MKKIFALFIISVIMLGTTVIAQTVTPEKSVDELVEEVIQTKGIDRELVEGVEEVDFNDLPEEINLKNIDDNNLALYAVNVTGEEKPVYIITASQTLFEKTVKKFAQRMALNFGFSGEVSQTTFLKTATGVVTMLDKGYVMTRDGSITGLSTNLEIVKRTNDFPIEVLIYKNGELVGFRNTFNAESVGVFNDYDTISGETLIFQKGDVISMKVNVPGGTVVKDITTLLEIETN